MPGLSILEINDPNEFVELIQVDQNEKLYMYIEDMFSPVGDIYESILKVYNTYLAGMMFTDIETHFNGNISNQYFSDIRHQAERRIICSPVICRYAPIDLQVFPDLEYHSFSFLQQAIKSILPWHIPEIGFTASLEQEQFKRLSADSKWVLQHVT